jgi:hypothetical protein
VLEENVYRADLLPWSQGVELDQGPLRLLRLAAEESSRCGSQLLAMLRSNHIDIRSLYQCVASFRFYTIRLISAS